MDIYNLTEVDTTMDGKRGVLLQGFNIIGVHGRPVVTFSFELKRRPKPRKRRCCPLSERPS